MSNEPFIWLRLSRKDGTCLGVVGLVPYEPVLLGLIPCFSELMGPEELNSGRVEPEVLILKPDVPVPEGKLVLFLTGYYLWDGPSLLVAL